MNKSIVRYLVIILAGLLIAFFAKMEAINFFLALPVGVTVTIYAYKYQESVYQRWTETNYQPPSWVLTLIVGFFMELYIWPIYFTLPLLAGFFSGYLVYSALNALFVLP